jgi:integrase
MARARKPPRLWLQDSDAKSGRKANYWIIDGDRKVRLGLGPEAQDAAAAALAEYIQRKAAATAPDLVARPASEWLIADVLAYYIAEKGPDLKNLSDVKRHAITLAEGFGGSATLRSISPKTCRDYEAWRTGQKWKTGGRRAITSGWHELKVLRSAVIFHRKAGLCTELVSITMPPPPKKRERWLTRSEAARLIWAAWRMKQAGTGVENGRGARWTGRHVARFILTGLYSGSRHGDLCTASPFAAIGRSYVDLERGIFHRLPGGKAESRTKKQPPAPIPPRLLAHMRRWHRLGLSTQAIIEWNGQPVARVKKSFVSAVKAAGFDAGEVVPHVLRHTAATWMMQNGCPTWVAAGYLGMSEAVLVERYGHHHPQFMGEAMEAVTRRPGVAERKVISFPRRAG